MRKLFEPPGLSALCLFVFVLVGRVYASLPVACPNCVVVWCETARVEGNNTLELATDIELDERYFVELDADEATVLEILGDDTIANLTCSKPEPTVTHCEFDATEAAEIAYLVTAGPSDSDLYVCHSFVAP